MDCPFTKQIRNRATTRQLIPRFEQLETRLLLSVDLSSKFQWSEALQLLEADAQAASTSSYQLQEMPIWGDTSAKPQSKVWQHDDQWFSVIADDSGTWVWRLDGLVWSPVLQIDSGRFRADVKSVGDVAHVLLYKSESSKLASIQYVPGALGTYELWAQRPFSTALPLDGSVETATLDVDSTGRMWVASDARTDVMVRYSDFPYTSFSAPITIASGISSDDISAITALPDDSVGVLWSNQQTDRFGFRVHNDSDPVGVWSGDEVPASQSALDVGGGMADDHLNLAVASDGTLYAAVKTSYNRSSLTEVGLLVRRPSGVWDPMYLVDTQGTRPIVAISEDDNRLLVAYRESDSAGPIVYRESLLSSIAFGAEQVLIDGTAVNNASGTKDPFSGELVVIGSGNGQLAGTRLATGPLQNQAPLVDAGSDQGVVAGTPFALDATVHDDGLPFPPGSVTTSWSLSSGPGSVVIEDPTALDTAVTLNLPGTYVFRLEANDGEFTVADEVQITGYEAGAWFTQSFQDGVLPDPTYAGTRDVRIKVADPSRNYERTTILVADGDPSIASLLQWDLGLIPSGVTVQSATLSLNVIGATADSYEIYELTQDWVEAEVTWNEYSSGNAWEISGAAGDTDRRPTVLGAIGPTSTGLASFPLGAAGIATVQTWIDDPTRNHGVIIQDYVSATDSVAFDSSEDATPTFHPRLDVTYVHQPIQNNPPVLDPIGDQTVVEGRSLGFTVSASDLDGDPLSYEAVGLPLGATFDAITKTFAWTPLDGQAGTYATSFVVSDGTVTDSEMITISVLPANDPPVLDPIGGQSVDEGVLLSFTVSASDPDLDPLTFSASNLPAGATFSPSTQTFTWTPAEDQDGTHTVTFSVTDGIDSDAETVTITVVEVNQPPVLTPIGDRQVTEGDPLSFIVSGSDPDGNPLTYWAAGLPPGATFDPGSRLFSWTPELGQAGVYSSSFTVSDSLATDSQTIVITVDARPTIVTDSFQDGVFPNATYAGTSDTRIKASRPTRNYGSSRKLDADGSPDKSAMIRWDLTSVPSGSTLQSVSLTIRVFGKTRHTYELYEVGRHWIEGEATWNQATATDAWQVPGAQGSADRGTTVLGTITAPVAGTYTFDLNPAGVAVVQAWIDNPADNFGLIVQDYLDASDGLDFDSSDVGMATDRPKLTLTYQIAAATASSLVEYDVGSPYMISGPTWPEVMHLTDPRLYDWAIEDDYLEDWSSPRKVRTIDFLLGTDLW